MNNDHKKPAARKRKAKVFDGREEPPIQDNLNKRERENEYNFDHLNKVYNKVKNVYMELVDSEEYKKKNPTYMNGQCHDNLRDLY